MDHNSPKMVIQRDDFMDNVTSDYLITCLNFLPFIEMSRAGQYDGNHPCP